MSLKTDSELDKLFKSPTKCALEAQRRSHLCRSKVFMGMGLSFTAKSLLLSILSVFILSGCLFEPQQKGYGEGVSGWDGGQPLVGSAFVSNVGHEVCAGQERELFEGIKLLSLEEAYLFSEGKCESFSRRLTPSEIATLEFSKDGKFVLSGGKSYIFKSPQFAITSDDHTFNMRAATTQDTRAYSLSEKYVIFYKAHAWHTQLQLSYNTHTKTLTRMKRHRQMANARYPVVVPIGDRLFVFGGLFGTVYSGLRTPKVGAIYDPANDTWEDLPTEGMPEGRAFGRGVWTGKEVIVFEGDKLIYDRGVREALPSNAAIYNPESRQWRPMSLEGAPKAPRSNAFWVGNEMIVVTTERISLRELVHAYNPESDSWRRLKVTSLFGKSVGQENHVYRKAEKTGNELLLWSHEDSGESVFLNLATEKTRPISLENAPKVLLGIYWNGAQLLAISKEGEGEREQASVKIYSYVTDSWETLDYSHPALMRAFAAGRIGNTFYVLSYEGSEKNHKLHVSELKVNRSF